VVVTEALFNPDSGMAAKILRGNADRKGTMKHPVAFASVLLMSAQSVLAVPLDFDGDGLSDAVGKEVQTDGSANEVALTFTQSSDSSVVRSEFGSHREEAVPADYDGDGKTDYAVVGIAEDNSLLWRFKLSNSAFEVSTATFGQSGDLVVFGCDFDGDEKSDMAVVRSGSSFLWQKSSDASLVTLELGVTEIERASCGDTTGDGIPELVGQKGSTTSTFFVFDALQGAKLLDVAFGRNVAGILVADTNGDGAKEIGYYRLKGGKGKALFFYRDSAEVSFRVSPFSAASIGTFVTGTGNADGLFLKLKRDDQFLRYAVLTDLTAPTSVALDDTESLQEGVGSVSPTPSQSQETACTIHHDPLDGNEGYLWKPISDTKGTAVTLMPQSLRVRNGTVKLVKAGTVLDTLSFKGIANGNRQHWLSKLRAAALPKGVTLMATNADGVHCWFIPDPNKRYD